MSELAYINYKEAIKKLPPLLSDSHKGSRGHVLLVGGGASHYSGAIGLAGIAALRAGAGLVSIVAAPDSIPLLARAPLELMIYGLESPGALGELLTQASVIVLGPGLTTSVWGKNFFEALINSDKPLVVDASALHLLAHSSVRNKHWVLTPHPGEAAALLNVPLATIQQDRSAAIKALHEQYGGVQVLKGKDTLVTDSDGAIKMHAGGFPGLSTAGTGDILAGLIGALIAQGMSLFDSAQLAVSVHALSAVQEESNGARGMIASDLLVPIRALLNP